MSLNFVRALGGEALRVVTFLGELSVFFGQMVRAAVTPPYRMRALMRELYQVGVLSLVIIGVSGCVVGAVLGLQGYNTLKLFGGQTALGTFVALTLVREMGPVFTGLLVTGRAGSAIAAEIGAMVATQQISGLRMMSIDPLDYVVVPRALAMLIAMPLLSMMFIVLGIGGGYITGVVWLGVDPGAYMGGIETNLVFSDDIVGSLIKSVVFGLLVGLIACYRGYTAVPNSEGVSAATTQTVVFASVSILVFDFFITALWENV